MEKSKQPSEANPSAKPPLSGAPPYHSVLVLGTVSALSLFNMPTLEEIDQVATIERLTAPLLPAYMSSFSVGIIRLIFAAFIVGTVLSRVYGPGREINPVPNKKSQLKPWKMVLAGWKSISTFTWWSFSLLGLSFSALASISLLAGYDKPVPQWLLRFGLLSFEISAPSGFLVSTVVKYALWPATLKNKGPEGTKIFKAFYSVVTHNVNVIMILIEMCMLGGTPVCWEHMAVGPTLGILYVLFTWFMMHRWVPHEKGPKFIYFFLDTTLGKDATIALVVLVAVLFGFYVLFATLCKYVLISDNEDGSLLGGNAIVPRLVILFGLSKFVCRFRD